MKLISGFLILTELVLALPIISSPAHAQTSPQPVSTIDMKFSDANRSKIEITVSSIGWQFSTGGSIALSDLANPTIASSQSLTQDMWKFSLTTPQSVCRYGTASDGAFDDSPLYLLIARTQNGEKYKQLGLFYMGYDQKYSIVKSGASDCKLTGDLVSSVEQLATILNSSFLYQNINWGISQGDTAGICSDLGSNWDNLKSGMRSILTSKDYWTKDVSTGSEKIVKLGMFIRFIPGAEPAYYGLLGGLNFFAKGRDAIDHGFPTEVDYNITAEGQAILDTVFNNAQKMQDDISMLSQTSDPSTMPCTNKLRKLKWDKANETDAESYTSLNEFSKDINEIVEKFKDYIKLVDEPVSSVESTDAVCEISGNIFVVNMFQQAFCAMVVTTKEWADSFYCWALGLLESSIGVATSEQQIANVNKPTTCTNRK